MQLNIVISVKSKYLEYTSVDFYASRNDNFLIDNNELNILSKVDEGRISSRYGRTISKFP
jgi:hypothetical protein